MTYLAFDTSGPLGSVAVGRRSEEGGVLARRFLRKPESHAAELLPAVSSVLSEAEVAPGDLAGVVVGAGPGSFTGVRVAAATAKGFAHALRIPLYAYSSLASGAVTTGLRIPGLDALDLTPAELVRTRVVLFDAREDRVYAAAYRITASGLETSLAPEATRLGQVLAHEFRGGHTGGHTGGARGGCVFCGSGARRHHDRILETGGMVLPGPAGVPTADALLALLTLQEEVEPVSDSALWEPEYLREWRPGWERKAG